MSTTLPATTRPPDMWDRAATHIGQRVRSWRCTRAKTKLEHDLARIVELVNGHQAKKLPPGAPAYVELYRQANLAIDAFCTKWTIDRMVIVQEVPVLRELEQLTHPPPAPNVMGKTLGVCLAVLLGALLIGCVSGLVSSGYYWTVHLFAH